MKTDPKVEQLLKVKHFVNTKPKNRRVEIILYQNEDDEFVFRVFTKRLVSFNDRLINTTDNYYTVETFILMSQLSEMFINSCEIIDMVGNNFLNDQSIELRKTFTTSNTYEYLNHLK